MVDGGWDIAMRNIDAELDLTQFEASALVREIAANRFRLPTADRARFQTLPDAVIARIEYIVLEAYLEAGEDVGEEILHENLWRQALTSRLEMIANRDLVTEADFRQHLDLSLRRLGELLADGSVFAIEVDDVEYYPTLLANPYVDRNRLQVICRIIVPAPPRARLDFLSSRRGSLGDRRPLDMLESDDDFRSLSCLAEAWAAEWSRTAVKLYEGEHQIAPSGVEPLYTAIVEIDPRRALWERASEALRVHGYQWPLGPYPDVSKFTLFVERQAAGDSTPTLDACVQILVNGEYIRIRIVAAPGTTLDTETVPAGRQRTFIDVAKHVIAHLCKR